MKKKTSTTSTPKTDEKIGALGDLKKTFAPPTTERGKIKQDRD